MRRIVFILSLILIIGIQTEAQYIYEGACIDVIQQDPTQSLYYQFNNNNVLPIYSSFVTPNIVNRYTQSITISDTEIEILYFKNKQTGYYDLPIQVESSGHIYNCYIRIQFIKK